MNFYIRGTVAALFVLLTFCSAAFAGVWDGYSGVWHFQGDGRDYSGNGITVVNQGGTSVAASNGNGIEFNGVSQYMETGNSTMLDLTGTFSIEVLFKAGTVTGTQVLLAKGNREGACNYTAGLSGDELFFSHDNAATYATADADLEAGTWYYAVFTYNQAAGQLLTYVNGTLAATHALSGQVATNGSDLYFAKSAAENDYFNGTLDEVRLLPRVLAPDEIAVKYAVLQPGFTRTTAPVEQGVQIDSAAYLCAGTALANDDTIRVFLTEGVDDASLDFSDGAAGTFFSITGMGSLEKATLHTGEYTNDNVLEIRLSQYSEPCAHNRSGLRLVKGSMDNLDGNPAVGNTKPVTTFNVVNKSNGKKYETILAALPGAADNDSVLIFDNGWYTDILPFSYYGGVKPVIKGVADFWPAIKFDGAGIDTFSSWMGHDLMVYSSNYGQAGAEFNHIIWDGVSEAGDTASTFAFIGCGAVKSCSLKCARTYFHTASVITVEDCDISGKNVKWASNRAGSRISGCTFRTTVTTIGLTGALSMYGADHTVVENCVFHGITGNVIFLRSADNNILRNNLVYGNSGQAVFQYNTLAADLPLFNTYLNNTVYGNTRGMELDSAALVAGNVCYGNTEWDVALDNAVDAFPGTVKYNLFGVLGNGMAALADTAVNLVGRDPGFTDAAGNDFTLKVTSPAIAYLRFDADSIAAYGLGTDLAGNARPMPAGSFPDLGALEEQTYISLYLTSAAYHSSGTEPTADDSLVLTFNTAVSDADLPEDIGDMLSVDGTGSLAGAIITTGAQADDNVLVIRPGAAGSALAHNRSTLVLRAGGVKTAGSRYDCDACESAVTTYNVYNARLGEAYPTILAAVQEAAAGDEIMVFDAGHYTDPLNFDDIGVRPAIIGAGDLYPAIVYDGTGLTDVSAWKGSGIMVHSSGASGLRFERIAWQGTSADGSIANRFAFIAAGEFVGCRLDNASVYAAGDQRLLLEDCDITGRGILWRNDAATSAVTGCTFHAITSDAVLLLYNGCNTLISRNTFHSITGSAIVLRKAHHNRILNNLVYGVTGKAVDLSLIGGESCSAFNEYVNNTVVGCGGGMELDSLGLVRNNIIYGCSGAGMWISSRAVQAASHIRYNLVDTAGSGLGALINGSLNIVTGADPLFTDAANNDFRLQTGSPCIEYSAFTQDSAQAYGITTDLDGAVRPGPTATTMDLGCYEAQPVEYVAIDSAVYYSCGTVDKGDDSLVVYLSRAISDAELNTVAGDADRQFAFTGYGSMAYATVTTGTVADDALLVIKMNAFDVPAAHGRTSLKFACARFGGYAASAAEAPVRTYNVHIQRLDTAYPTILAALQEATDDDEIKIYDAGYYTDPLNFNDYGVVPAVIGMDDQYPSIVNDGQGIAGLSDWKGTGIMVHYSVYHHTGPRLQGLRFAGVSAAGDTAGRFAYFGSGTVVDCKLDCASVYAGRHYPVTFENCDFNGRGLLWRNTYADAAVKYCTFRNISTVHYSGALNAYSAKNTVIDGNVFHDISGNAVQLRNAHHNKVRNNLIYNVDAKAIDLYIGSTDTTCTYNQFLNNTIANCTDGMEVDSMGVAFNNIIYGCSGMHMWMSDRSAQVPGNIRYNLVDTAGSGLGGLVDGTYNLLGGIDPLFVDAGAGDFHLQTGSPAIGFSSFNQDSAFAYGLNTDLEQVERPLPAGNKLDLGAFEETTVHGNPLDDVAPAAPTGLVASAVDTFIRLTWEASASDDVAGYRVYRNVTGGEEYGFVADVGNAVTYDDGNTLQNMEYYYVVTAFDVVGNESEYSSAQSVKTLSRDLIAPEAPSNLNGILTGNKIVLNWDACENEAGDLEFYKLYKKTGAEGNYSLLISLYYSDYEFKDYNIVSECQYYYKVSAVDIFFNESGFSNEVSVSTNDIAPPQIPGDLTAFVLNENKINLDWSIVEDNDLLGYSINRASALSDTVFNIEADEVGNYIDSNVVPGNTYIYSIASYDTNHNYSELSNDIAVSHIDTFPPEMPLDFQVIAAETSLILTWYQEPAEVNDYDKYIVFRKNSDMSVYLPLDSLPSTSSMFNDIGINREQAYDYRLVLTDEYGNVSCPAEIYGIRLPDIDSLPPAIPTNVGITKGGGMVLLTWDAGNEINQRFRVYHAKSDDELAAYELLAEVSDTFYADSSVLYGPDTVYYYKISSVDSALNESDCSPIDSIIFTNKNLDFEPPIITELVSLAFLNEGVNIVWHPNPDDDADLGGYLIGRAAANSQDYKQLADVGLDTSYIDISALPGNSYNYVLVTYDVNGNFSQFSLPISITILDTFPPLPPSLNQLDANINDVLISWENTDGQSDDVDRYKIYRSKFGNEDYICIDSVIDDQYYVDTDVMQDSSYQYYVTALDKHGNESDSSGHMSIIVVDDNTPPDSPSQLTVVALAGYNSLEWVKGEENYHDLLGHIVYRRTASEAMFTIANELWYDCIDSNYVDDDVISGVKYYYKVSAIDNDSNESSASNIDSAVAVPQDWWNLEWSMRNKISINALQGEETIYHDKILIKLTDAVIDYDSLNGDGSDLRFVSLDSTQYDFEIETWNNVGISYVWVNIPEIDMAADTLCFWMYYNNTGADIEQEPSAIWTMTYRNVYHLSDLSDGAGSSNNIVGNDIEFVPSVINNAVLLNGSSSYLKTSHEIEVTNRFAIECWVNVFDTILSSETKCLVARGNAAPFAVYISTDKLVCVIDNPIPDTITTNISIKTNEWWQFVLTFDNGLYSLYKNGELVTEFSSNVVSCGSFEEIYFGVDSELSSDKYLNAIIDEVRISNYTMSEPYLRFQYSTIMDASFITLDTAESVYAE